MYIILVKFYILLVLIVTSIVLCTKLGDLGVLITIFNIIGYVLHEWTDENIKKFLETISSIKISHIKFINIIGNSGTNFGSAIIQKNKNGKYWIQTNIVNVDDEQLDGIFSEIFKKTIIQDKNEHGDKI